MRQTSLFLYIKLKSGHKRGMQGRKSRGCRGWHPHPAENPFARNRGWLSAVVTLSSTGDAACGLHKQCLRHASFPKGVAAAVAGWGWNGGGSGGTGSERNAPTLRCIQPHSVCTPATTRNTSSFARHLSVPYNQTGSLLPVSCRLGGIQRALKDAPGAKRQRASLSDTSTRQPTDGSLPAFRLCHRDPNGGKPFDILPTKVQAKLPRLSRAYVPAASPFCLHDTRSSLFHSFTRSSKRGEGDQSSRVNRTTASIDMP